jgi:preprotein translocase subunit SecF
LKKVRVINNEKGFIKFLFILVIFVSLIYTGIKFALPFYRYSALKADAKAITRISLGDIKKTRADILERAQELKVPIKENQIVVTKTETMVRVQTSWSETVDLLGLYQKRLNFRIDVEE